MPRIRTQRRLQTRGNIDLLALILIISGTITGLLAIGSLRIVPTAATLMLCENPSNQSDPACSEIRVVIECHLAGYLCSGLIAEKYDLLGKIGISIEPRPAPGCVFPDCEGTDWLGGLPLVPNCFYDGCGGPILTFHNITAGYSGQFSLDFGKGMKIVTDFNINSSQSLTEPMTGNITIYGTPAPWFIEPPLSISKTAMILGPCPYASACVTGNARFQINATTSYTAAISGVMTFKDYTFQWTGPDWEVDSSAFNYNSTTRVLNATYTSKNVSASTPVLPESSLVVTTLLASIAVIATLAKRCKSLPK